MTSKQFRESVPFRDALRQFLDTPAGSNALDILERSQKPVRVTIPGMPPTEYMTLMAQLQIFQTGWNECLKALRNLTSAPKTNEPEQQLEAYEYLIPESARKAAENA
jgi:hypothetical protein